jgi:cystathionine beta-lyase
MKYDFDTIINRKNTGSFKWDAIELECGPSTEDIIALSVADMEFKVAPEIVSALHKKVDAAVFGYTGPTSSYYEAVIGWMKKRHNWEIKKEWISLSPGVVPAFYTAIRAFTHPGDKVIIQQPVYYPFVNAIIRNGCEVVNNPLIFKDGHYTMDYADLEEKAKDPRVKAIILCSPHNPACRVWREDELVKLGEICIKNGVLIISDEIHFDFVYKPHKHTVFASINDDFKENCLVLTAPSKSFNLAGLQCSNIIIPNPKLKQRFDIAVLNISADFLNYFSFSACEAAYNDGEEWFDQLLGYLEGNIRYVKDYVAEKLPQISVVDTEGTYLVWIDCRSLGLNNTELEKLMKEKARLFLDEGYIFGADGSGFERINVACPRAILEKAMNNFEIAINSIKNQNKLT